jgi:hypothetical protein
MLSAALKGLFFADFLSAFKEIQSPVGESPDGSKDFMSKGMKQVRSSSYV